MIVKNEENYLDDCLNSVSGVADEIVVVDTGSSDSTLQIAKKYNSKIFSFDWIDDFSAARNFALSKCSGNWILYMDADERLSEESKAELKFLDKGSNDTAYNCTIKNLDEVNSRPSLMNYVRFFPNKEGISFEGKIHEQIEPSLLLNGIKIKNSNIEIIHYGYSLNNEGKKNKAQRNLKLLLKQFQQNPSSYYALQLGQTYGILNDKESAEKYFLIALKDPNLKKEYKSTAYRYLAIQAAEKNNYKKAVELINNSINTDANQPLALLAASKIYNELKDYSNAVSYAEQAYTINNYLEKNRVNTAQTILVDSRIIIYYLLELSINSNDLDLFNKYFFLLKEMGSDNSKLLEAEFIHTLLNNLQIKQEKINDYAGLINLDNFGFYLLLMEKYNSVSTNLLIMNSIYERFEKSSLYLNKLAIFYSKKNDFRNAEKILMKSLETNPNDPSTYFYTLSLYVKENRLNEIESIINEMEIKFKDNHLVSNKVFEIKSKLKKILTSA